MTQTAGGVTTSFLYDGGEVLLEKQGTTTTATYTYGNVLVRKDGETPLFDGLGPGGTMTNAGGPFQVPPQPRRGFGTRSPAMELPGATPGPGLALIHFNCHR